MPSGYSMQVLDHGYVTLIETWGSDERIIEAARQSTGGAFRGWVVACPDCDEGYKGDITSGSVIQCPKCNGKGRLPGDEKLLRHLWTHDHSTPFEMAGAVFEVQLPIFVAREWHRHRTQSYNEMSSRYVELPNLQYVPSIERLMSGGQSTTNKQSSADATFNPEVVQKDFIRCNQYARHDYERLLRAGVARELARLVVPVSQYTRMRASANLLNWLKFLKLRTAGDAQWEIRQYAAAVLVALQQSFPRTCELAFPAVLSD